MFWRSRRNQIITSPCIILFAFNFARLAIKYETGLWQSQEPLAVEVLQILVTEIIAPFIRQCVREEERSFHGWGGTGRPSTLQNSSIRIRNDTYVCVCFVWSHRRPRAIKEASGGKKQSSWRTSAIRWDVDFTEFDEWLADSVP